MSRNHHRGWPQIIHHSVEGTFWKLGRVAAQPPRSDDPGALARLKEALVASDYTHDGLRRVLGQSLTPAPAEIPLTERRLPPGERITTIIRLFLLDLSVARADAATALAPLGVEGAEALGLVASGDGEVRPLLRVTPSGSSTSPPTGASATARA